MKIQVCYYGMLTEAAGCEHEFFESANLRTANDLLALLKHRYSGFSKVPIVFFAHNKKLLNDQKLSDNLSIDCMPPFSGG